MSGGYVPLWRKMYEPGHWLAPTKRDPSCRRDAWCYLFQLAAWKDVETVNSGTLRRGELVASLRKLGERFQWSKDRVKRFMSDLEVRTAVETVRETPDGIVYRVVNYDTYATVPTDERDTERDANRDRSETGARQEEEVKKVKREETTLVHACTDDGFPVKPKKKSGNYEYPEPFERAWAAYPSRDGSNPKVGAYKAFRARVKDGSPVEDLVKAAEHYREHCQHREQEGTPYVQQASTFYGPQEPWAEFVQPSTNGNGTHWAESL